MKIHYINYMGEKDIAEKTLEAYNDVFADIVNVLLFDGKRLVQENGEIVNCCGLKFESA